jgi:hypothetical protein
MSTPNDLQSPRSAHDLGPDAEIVFRGVLRFKDRGGSYEVTATALADGCVGDRVAGPFCEVDEFGDENNASAPITFTVPTFNVPD